VAFAPRRGLWSPLALMFLAIAACGGRESGPASGSTTSSGLATGSTRVSANSSGASMTSSVSGAIEAGLGPDATPGCMIPASNYDQSCAADSDCVGVTPGNYCGSNPTCNCGGFTDAISVGALGQFNADVAKTPSGPQVTCPCPMTVVPPGTTSSVCCKNNTCGVCTTVLPPVCTPMAARCLGNGINTCGPDGQWQQAVEVCGPGETCVEGSCVAVEAGAGAGQDSGSVVASILGAGCEQEEDAGVRNFSDSCITEIPLVGPCFVSAGSPTPWQCAELCAWTAPSLSLPVQACGLVKPAPDGGTYLACHWPCLR
jgi:hypothetical protein